MRCAWRQAGVTETLTQVPGVPDAVQRNIEPVLPTTRSPLAWAPVVGRPEAGVGTRLRAARPPENDPPTEDVEVALMPSALVLAARTPDLAVENPQVP